MTDIVSAAPLTVLFLVLNLVLFVVSAMRSGDMGNIDSQVLIAMGGSLREGLWSGEWYRLIAPNFLHAGLLHIMFNGITLYSLGPAAEVYFGSANYGTLYLLSGVAGFCFSQILGGTLSIGASCSLFGIMGALLAIRIAHAPVLSRAWRNTDVRRMFYFLLFYIAIGFAGVLGPMDNWGHLGGALIGLLLGGFFELWRTRRRLGPLLVLGMLALVGGLVCAARWSVFNPYFHVYNAALAAEAEQPADAERHWEDAYQWSRVWRAEQKVALLRAAHEAGRWRAADAESWGHSLKYYARYLESNFTLIPAQPVPTPSSTPADGAGPEVQDPADTANDTG